MPCKPYRCDDWFDWLDECCSWKRSCCRRDPCGNITPEELCAGYITISCKGTAGCCGCAAGSAAEPILPCTRCSLLS